MKEAKKETEDETTCYSCKGLTWIPFSTPRKLRSFIYSRKNLLITLIITVVTYLVTSGQPEMVRKTLATFVFAAGCWIFEVFPLPVTGLMIPVVLTLLARALQSMISVNNYEQR